uniref:Protein kinase domain-containing protein n=1 Tax=Arcella intermedia TaxID=1963864 RepID=A0A6B2LF83_9EUKA
MGEATKLEIQILHLLSSEFCISVIESMETADSIYILMEYCSGGNLFDSLDSLVEKDFLDVASHLLSAVSYLHSIGICHRDIKPDNIFLDASTRKWKLADFGISCFFTEENPLMDGIMGSVQYIAPEVFQSHYTKAVDIWSSGVTLFVIISKCFPWLGTEENELIDEIMSNAVVWGPGWSSYPDARDFVISLMRSDPEQRPTAAAAFGHKWLRGHQ